MSTSNNIPLFKNETLLEAYNKTLPHIEQRIQNLDRVSKDILEVENVLRSSACPVGFGIEYNKEYSCIQGSPDLVDYSGYYHYGFLTEKCSRVRWGKTESGKSKLFHEVETIRYTIGVKPNKHLVSDAIKLYPDNTLGNPFMANVSELLKESTPLTECKANTRLETQKYLPKLLEHYGKCIENPTLSFGVLSLVDSEDWRGIWKSVAVEMDPLLKSFPF